MIRRYYARSIIALVLIPLTAMLAATLSIAIDPELARGHRDYVRLYALIGYVSTGVRLAGLVLVVALWLLACDWLVRAKARSRAWMLLALFGPPGFAVLTTLRDQSPDAPEDIYRRQLARLARPLRVLYEILRFLAFAFIAMQLVEWQDDATALFEASRRGVALAQVLAERDASSGMWAFGDLLRAAMLFVMMYALWPGACNLAARLIRRLRGTGGSAGPSRAAER